MNISKMGKALLLILSIGCLGTVCPAADDSPPESPVKLIFIHHSTGGNWLADPGFEGPYGGLGLSLRDNNYYVSATNYGWGYGSIGDRTDIPNWPEWFTRTNSTTILNELYNENEKNIADFGDWSRLATSVEGENEIVMFKSCFPNSDLYGDTTDPPGDAPGDQYTLSNAKAVYNDILTYFQTRPDKLFIVVTAPPQLESEYSPDYQTAAHRAANARAFNDWLVEDWLDNYPYKNVAVFDYFNVLTAAGNHHRYVNGAVEHVTVDTNNFAIYTADTWDSHPSTTGHQKATSEFVPLLNYHYNTWKADEPDDDEVPLSRLYFPHVASNSTWETEIGIINTGIDENFVATLRSYDDAGTDLNEDVIISLPPDGRRQLVIGQEMTAAEQIAYIVLDITSGSAAGYTKFWIDGRYRVALPAVSQVNTGDIYLTHIAANDQWWTGIGLLNTTSATKSLSIEYNNGIVHTLSLEANAHSAMTVRQLFGGSLPPAGTESAIIRNAAGVIGLELFGSHETSPKNYLSGILLNGETAYRLDYPHVTDGTTWWTGIVVFNPSSEACPITLTPYRRDGTRLSAQTLSIPGYGKIFGSATDMDLPAETEWFSIDATRQITGFELFGTHTGRQLGGYTVVNISGQAGLFAKKTQTADGWVGIAFVNTTGLTASVSLVAHDDGGTTVANETITLDPYEKLVGTAQELFSQDISLATWIRFSSDREIVGFQLNGSTDDMLLDGLPALPAPARLLEPADPPAPRGLVQPADFEYLGAFRLPGGETPPETFAYGGEAMTFNPDGDPSGENDGFPGSLFIVGHESIAVDLPDGNQVAEVTIPEPVDSKTPEALSQADFIQDFSVVTNGFFTGMEEIPRIGMAYLDAPETGPKIHFSRGQHLYADLTVPTHAWFDPDLSTPDMQGTWFIGNHSLYSTTDYLFEIPDDWSGLYAHGRQLATGRFRDGGWGSMGPALFAYRPWTDGNGTPAASGTHLENTLLLRYEDSQTTESIEHALNNYQHPDEWTGGAWITTSGGNSAVLFAGTKGTGAKYWYGFVNPAGPESPCVEGEMVGQYTLCRNADGTACPSADLVECQGHNTMRGWWSSRFDAQLILYDPDELAGVTTGEMDSWEPQPYAVIDIDEHLLLQPPVWDQEMLGTGVQRRFRIGAVAYDRDNDLLYVLERFATEDAMPVVHVWRIT
jgi:hypothetical protein